MRTSQEQSAHHDQQQVQDHLTKLPTAFCGTAQKELYRLYGDPRLPGWGNKWMVLWKIQQEFSWFPTDRLYIHKDFRQKLQEAFHALEMQGLHHEIRTFDGCYHLRYVRGSNSALSVHSFILCAMLK